MSATNRSDCRDPDDFYETPTWVTRSILKRIPRPAPGAIVLDPCCGRGAILDVVKETWSDVWTIGIEIDEGRADTARQKGHHVVCADALTRGVQEPVAVIIQNPAFKLVMPFVEFGNARARMMNVVLARNSLVASGKRAEFWHNTPAFLHFLPKRPSFAVSRRCKAQGCKWAAVYPHDHPPPKVCPVCGAGKLISTSSDSADYVWVRFGTGVERGWELLPIENVPRKAKKAKKPAEEAKP
jgi:hypothetical protein